LVLFPLSSAKQAPSAAPRGKRSMEKKKRQ